MGTQKWVLRDGYLGMGTCGGVSGEGYPEMEIPKMGT